MRTSLAHLPALGVLVAGAGLAMCGEAVAQTFKTLHSFPALSGNVNGDGANPMAGLVLSSNVLYGTANNGGTAACGTVFSIEPSGTNFQAIHTFDGTSQGCNPRSGLILSTNTLYGTTYDLIDGQGTVFGVNTNGSPFSSIFFFSTPSDGDLPLGGLVLLSNLLYGTTSADGPTGFGTVFRVNPDSMSFTNIHKFSSLDGTLPRAGLVLSGNTFYGVASSGGSGGGPGGSGTLFQLDTDGSGFAVLHNFTSGSDGGSPFGALMLSGTTLYGTTSSGGAGGGGTVFKLDTGTTNLTTLYTFPALRSGTNLDGSSPQAALILGSQTLFGTTYSGGRFGKGIIFQVNTDGTGFKNLHDFTGGSDGANPLSSLVLSSNTLYGTAEYGGSAGNGTVFSLTLPPPVLSIAASGTSVILTWPTNAVGFALQTTTNLAPADWAGVSPVFVVNGLNTVTNAIAPTPRYFRLEQ
jgi:uncharacterized repeat protein (TIGR03803 family)